MQQIESPDLALSKAEKSLDWAIFGRLLNFILFQFL